MFTNRHIFSFFSKKIRDVSTMVRIVLVALLLCCFRSLAWAYDVEITSFTTSFSSNSVIYTATASDGSVITITSSVGSGQEGSVYYAQLGNTPSSGTTTQYYVEISSTGSAIESVEFLLTCNSNTAKEFQPVVLLWDSDVQTNSADSALIVDAKTIAKGIANAEWFVYDCGDSDTHTARIYRAVKGIVAPPYTSGTIGNGQSIYIYGIRITLVSGDNKLIWSDGLKDGGTVNKFNTDDSFTYVATATQSTGAITYSSSNTSIATVDANTGEVTLTGALGDAVITAHQAADGTYEESSISYTLHVTELTNLLSWSNGLEDGATVTKLLSDGSISYSASANLSDGAITYSSSDPSVATVDQNGNVTFLGAGSTTITATQAATAQYASSSISYTLTLSAADCSKVTISWSGKKEGRIKYAESDHCEVNGKTYYAPGLYEEYTEYNADGCPIKGYVAVIGADSTDFYCKGTTYYWRGQETTSTTKTFTYKSASVKYGSTSYYYTITNYVVRKDATNSTTNAIIDFGESYEWFGKLYQKTGVYHDTTANMYGCDSTGVLYLTVCGEATGDTIVGICRNEGKTSVTVWGETFSAPATRTRIYKTAAGCDSLVTLHVVNSSPTAGIENVTINKGESYYWRYTETSYTTTQDVSVTLKNYCGCDSTLTLHLVVQDIPADGKHLAKTICEGDVYTWHGQSYTTAGTYVAKDCDSVLHLGVLPNPNIEVCEDQVIDYKSSTQVWVGGADYYAWDNDHALSSEWSDQPTAFPDTTTTFHVKSYNSAAANTISNGDFEMGKNGSPAGTNPQFSTDAEWSTQSGKYGKYIIAHNTSEMWSSDNYYDHTKGTADGNMMVVDGFDEPDKIIWQQTVSVTPNTDYIFSAWFLSLKSSFDKDSYAKFQFFVNGEQLGPVTNAPNTKGKWGRYYELWDSGNETTAVLTIKNQNTDGKGNDFALDDISFQALGPCYGYDSVKVITNFNVDLYGDGTMVVEQRSDYVDRHITYHIEHHTDQIGSYYHGDQITVRVYNTECAEFVRWSDGETTNPRIFTVGESDFTVQPIFVGEPFTITTNQIGQGNVTGGQQYWCKDTATITATPDECWRFVKWQEDGDTNPVRVFEVTEERTLTAIFEGMPYVITIKTQDGTTAQGSVTGNKK